ncbi:flagellar biosynthetic protein FliO [Sphingomonas sp. DT-51]|uniref:flagellar biosynthetic protein FliO n=1 Tax=Sphingomonas sp. DT-51 TaxID=3396165 RepID=UPI003F1A80A3
MGLGTVVSSVVALVLSLGMVLALAWGSIYLLRRWQERSLGSRAAGVSGERALRFVRALPLGPRERIVMVEVGGETLLLGIGAGGVTLLKEWSGSDPSTAQTTTSKARPAGELPW